MARKKPLPVKYQYIDHILKSKKKKTKRRRSKILNPSSHNIYFKSPTESLCFGELLIGTTNHILPSNWEKCNATFISNESENLALTFNENTTVVVLLNVEGDIIKDEDDDEEVEEASKSRKKSSSDDINTFYKDIASLQKSFYSNLVTIEMEDSRLKPILRKYQKEAVTWMLHREQQTLNNSETPHPLYTKVDLKSGNTVYFDKYSGHIEVNQPMVSVSNSGGILADEMGLGKTVEVLACILKHKNPTVSRTSVESESSSEDSEEEDTPLAKIVCNKRPLQETNPQPLRDCSKRLKVPNDWVKPSKPKSQLKVALEMWYESLLSQHRATARKETVEIEEPSVQCICGDTSEKGSVICVDCQKIQHGRCLGYKKKTCGHYRCPKCWLSQPLLESGATLIVCPLSLRTQWVKEVSKHIRGDFKVLQYEGSSATPIYPTSLLKYDLVITTYSVLQSELRLTNNEPIVALRRQKRYDVPGSPLICINWWRLCLDEAQMVDSPTHMVSEMAQKINATFRWAVTGTPISNGVSDIYGLITYLQMKPYDEFETWKNLLYNPYLRGDKEPMYNFLKEVMWRNCKQDVLNQINIPKQTIEEHWLEFSAVEKYFYKREHELSCDAFLAKVRTYDSGVFLHSLDRKSFKKVLAPLLYIRQACTFPNTVRGRYLATKKQVSSMKDLLDALILKTITECEESLRVVISSLNGLAGIYLLLKNPLEASLQYRKVLQFVARFTENEKETKLSADKLQLVHTLHNLAEILDTNSNIPPTCRDSDLRNECVLIEQKYIEKFTNQSKAAYKDSAASTLVVNKLQNKFILSAGQWFSDLLECVSIGGFFDDLLSKIRSTHDVAGVECPVNLSSERYIMFLISTWDDQLSELRESLIEKINALYNLSDDEICNISIDQNLVAKATDCHLRPHKKVKKSEKCALCLANTYLKRYEFKLFSMQKRSDTYEEMSLKGCWKATNEELILKALLALGKSKSVDPSIIRDGENHMHILDALKKEFKEIRKFWTFLDQQICAQDELDMCKIRLTLKEPNTEEKPKNDPAKDVLKKLTYVLENKLDTLYVLSEHELDYHRTVLKNEETQGMSVLEKNLGVASYLKTLRKQQYEGQSPDPCPICKNALEEHWSILPCGHSFCLECINSLLECVHGSIGHLIQCSVCREKQKICDISYIKADSVVESEDSVKIVGNYSTKIEAVIRLLVTLKCSNSSIKILVFSCWNTLLKCLKEALEKNSVSCELLMSCNFEKKIENFKDSTKKNINVLLIPVTLGAKGLNLIEATHVILVEPLLNPADELQAIGRVHRIGQTKPTFVHKFLIKNTIEENIQHATTVNAESWDKNRVTLGQLTNLFMNTEEAADNTESEVINVVENEVT